AVKPPPPSQDPTLLNNTVAHVLAHPADPPAAHVDLPVGSADGGLLGANLARVQTVNVVLPGATLAGLNRAQEFLQSGGDAASAGRLAAAAAGPVEKAPAARAPESSGLGDELFASLPLTLPQLELPSEKDLLAGGGIPQALLVPRPPRA